MTCGRDLLKQPDIVRAILGTLKRYLFNGFIIAAERYVIDLDVEREPHFAISHRRRRFIVVGHRLTVDVHQLVYPSIAAFNKEVLG